MKIQVLKTPREFDLAVAWKIIGQILAKPNSMIGLATGETTKGIHRTIAEIYNNAPFDVSQVRFYGVDEIVMGGEAFKETCAAMILRELINPLNISINSLIMPPIQHDDYEKASMEFEKEICDLGGSDMQILGIGMDGHVGMNLPGTHFESNARFTQLSGELNSRIRKGSNYPDSAPLAGITLGIKSIMSIPRIILAAKGAGKALIIKAALEGPITTDIPASVLQLHPNIEVILDSDAASMIGNNLKQYTIMPKT